MSKDLNGQGNGNDVKKKYESRIPKRMNDLIVYADNIVKTVEENQITDDRSLKIVLKISNLKGSLVTVNSIQQKMIRDTKKQSSRVRDLYVELENQIKDLYRFLKYLYGPKSDEILDFGFVVGKSTVPDNHSELLALADAIVANAKAINVTDEEILSMVDLIGKKKTEVIENKAKKSTMISSQKDTTIKVEDNIDELYETIRELIRYLEFKYGPKSEEFLKYAIEPLK